jgi:hypothetical protein
LKIKISSDPLKIRSSSVIYTPYVIHCVVGQYFKHTINYISRHSDVTCCVQHQILLQSRNLDESALLISKKLFNFSPILIKKIFILQFRKWQIYNSFYFNWVKDNNECRENNSITGALFDCMNYIYCQVIKPFRNVLLHVL